MNIGKLEQTLKSLVSGIDKDTFVYDFLLAYELPQASITRLQRGDYNLSKQPGEVLWKKRVCFRIENSGDLHTLIDSLQNDQNITKHHPRFIIVTDFEVFLAVDTKNKDSLDIQFNELHRHYDFFLPWAGMEKSQLHSENPADIKAAERMGKLYDLILEDNPVSNDAERHALNVFLSRLLFCFFAEDTGIFKNDQFTNSLASHTSNDGSDLQAYLQKLFLVLNTIDHSEFPKYLQEFPYVNGGLFAEDLPVPRFSAKSRKIILECGELNWKAINPDIFGSMIQAVIHEDMRGGLGMHYTSVTNIMKVIKPLFLDELEDELAKAGESKTKLKKFLERIYNLKIFDPACGSGNFLIITYKELCKLEIEAFKRFYQGRMAIGHSKIKLTQFYGIELDDFAHETAKLSMWLAEHQMNLAFKEIFGETKPTLPLQDGGNIICGNATRLDWEDICPARIIEEVFILGNPPYRGARNQDTIQKMDIAEVFNNHKDYKDSDYVCCWFLKGAAYIVNNNASLAFVSTNSITQGEQVSYLWTRLLAQVEITFAHKAFKWTNSAKGNAGVTCVIIGLSKKSSKDKQLFLGHTVRTVKNISPYLHEGGNIIVHPRKTHVLDLPKMVMGNMPRDGGNLILSDVEAKQLLEEYPESSKLIRKLYGAEEFLNSKLRWCLWINDEDLQLAKKIPPISERIRKIYKLRSNSSAKTTRQYASIPHKFAQRSYSPGISIIVPCHSSEKRKYIPFGFLDDGSIVSNSAMVINGATPVIFAFISSYVHMLWIRTVAGGLETRIRYSAGLCYNTFPFPEIDKNEEAELEDKVFKVLDEREYSSDKTMAQLYNPGNMPEGLAAAHRELDTAVEKCYRTKPFSSDEERLKFLFDLYEERFNA